jgi:hypothetical protein
MSYEAICHVASPSPRLFVRDFGLVAEQAGDIGSGGPRASVLSEIAQGAALRHLPFH